MKSTLFSIGLIACSLAATAQNYTGIGTAAPGSRLTVNGSVGLSYSSTTSDYSLGKMDYFVEYNGTGYGNIYLPTAVSGAGNFQGRIYKIKNSSANTLAIVPASGETVNGNPVIIIAAGHTAEVISTGATTGSTWDLLKAGALVYTVDGMRNALAGAGCASCAAYDAAATDAWVNVTAAEFTAIEGMTGMGGYGASLTAMGTARSNQWSGFTVGPSTADMTQLPASTYPVGVMIQAGNVSTLAGFKLKLSTTSASSGFADMPASGATTPGLSTGTTTTGANYYFILKKSSTASASGSASYVGFYTPSNIGVGIISGSTSVPFSSGDVSTLSSTWPTTINLVRVVGTSLKQW